MKSILIKPLSLLILTYISISSAYSADVRKTGDIVQLLIPAAALGSTFYMDDKEGRNQFYKGFATNIAITYGLKYTVDKKRPNGKSQSFPSGHTSAAFNGAAFIHERYGIKYAIPAYLGAAFVGYSRIEADKHYPIDVAAGAAIGILSARYFTTPKKNFTAYASYSPDYYGIQFVYQD